MGPRKETTIERIFREVTGHKMPPREAHPTLQAKKPTQGALDSNDTTTPDCRVALGTTIADRVSTCFSTNQF
jgi:hypothetical protein